MRKPLFLSLLFVLFAQLLIGQTVQNNALERFKTEKFGMFLHWGLYAQTAGDWKNHKVKGGEHFMLYERIPVQEYGTIAHQFNPVKFDADAWVKQAKETGMKYIVFTAKHHDGFAMYNSASSDYNIVKRSPFKRDPIAELAKACKKYQIDLCLYYSLGRDWQDPDVPTNWPVKAGRSNTWDYPNEDAKVFNRYFERKVKPQITELLTNYGPIGVLWFDTPELISKKESAELKALVHKLQPNCLVNNRIGNGYGDFSISEQSLAPSSKQAWESCLTIGQNWGYNKHDSVWKSPEVLARHLVEVVANGGNLLLNVGPKGDGTFPDWATARLKALGKWMDINNEAIYNSHPWLAVKENANKTIDNVSIEESKNAIKDAVFDGTPKNIVPDVYYTSKNKVVYAFLRSWQSTDVTLKQIDKNKLSIKNIELMGNKNKVRWSVTDQELKLNLPEDFKKGNQIPVYVLKITTN
ncbi:MULTISPECIES: alpha-L-fucosidase [unclassified Pedobacter]|uniref:alpha-L-fucosidase n=1 Tax=unclassified Pedobacter TaxID=2628915 RepID=UPI001423FC97|nr:MULTISPECIES: alpha-L-fucosidase [unclassified Pedobacter]NII83048.1 alpha-L-fucosidase [Pedobacter sp. SG908]NMN37066.1 alpha-L-fucosidase [Pedobacter sp. SG918]